MLVVVVRVLLHLDLVLILIASVLLLLLVLPLPARCSLRVEVGGRSVFSRLLVVLVSCSRKGSLALGSWSWSCWVFWVLCIVYCALLCIVIVRPRS